MRIETFPSTVPTQYDQIWPHKREPPVHWRTQEMPVSRAFGTGRQGFATERLEFWGGTFQDR